MAVTLVISQNNYAEMREHLMEDGHEAAAIMLCHLGTTKSGNRFIVNEVILIPRKCCVIRRKDHLVWPFEKFMPPEKIEQIDREGLSIVTVHSHPNGQKYFSETDDKNDSLLISSICCWFDDDRPNGAAIMLPDGEIFCRCVDRHGKFTPVQTVTVVGEDIKIWKKSVSNARVPEHGIRIAQTLGKGTFNLLRNLNVGVVGCSGTGSIIIEFLARNCIGGLVLVDPDIVEEKNLNRIVNVDKYDAESNVPKVEAIKKSIMRFGLGTNVDIYVADTRCDEVIDALADCDVIFGCVDSASGRYHLEALATAYYIPYFDVGVFLEADGKGNISQADAAAHYIHPDCAGLMARGCYTTEQITAENRKAENPENYQEQRKAGYLVAVGEDHPAVISINAQAACLAFNDFLARLHIFRLDSNDDFETQRFQLVQGYYSNSTAGARKHTIFEKNLGMGDRSFWHKTRKR